MMQTITSKPMAVTASLRTKRTRSDSDPATEPVLSRRATHQTASSPILPFRTLNLQSSHSYTIQEAPSKRLFRAIKARMERSGFNMQGLTDNHFQWCLPKDENVTDGLVSKFINAPITVSDDELKRLLVLQIDIWTPPEEREKAHHFYIKSYPLKVARFLQLVNLLVENSCCPDKLQDWSDIARKLPHDDTIWIRYCGTTRLSVFERELKVYHQHDSFYSSFYQFLDSKYPDIIRDSVTYEVPEATLSLEDHESLVNLREKGLIALFGSENLLNGQAGGKGYTVSMDIEDEHWFHTLQTQTYLNVVNSTMPASEDVRESVRAYVEGVDETGLIPQGFADMMFRQALPRTTIRSRLVPFAIIGADPIEKSFGNAQSFLETANSASTDIVRSIIKHMVAWELNLRHMDMTYVSHMHSHNALPFIDMFPWPKKMDDNIDTALKLTAKYLQGINPIVLLTFSHKVSSAAATAFKRANGINANDFVDCIGVPRLVSAPNEGVHVLIPSYHPGCLVQYSAKMQESLYKIIAYSFFICWLGIHHAVIVSETITTREQISTAVMDVIAQKCGPTTPFRRRFRSLKTKFHEDLRSHMESTQKFRSLIVPRPADERLASRVENAVPGQKPGRGMIKPVHTLDGASPRSLELKSHVAKWYTARKQLVKLVLRGRACDVVKTRKITRDRLSSFSQLLSLFDQSNNSTVGGLPTRNHQDFNRAVDSMRKWIQRQVHVPMGTVEVDVSASYDKFVKLMEGKAPDLLRALRWEVYHTMTPAIPWGRYPHGMEVFVRSVQSLQRAVMSFRWINRKGKTCSLGRLVLPPGTEIIFPSEIRRLFFFKQGISIRDGDGHTLGLAWNRDVTMDRFSLLEKLVNDPLKEDFMDFWDHQLADTRPGKRPNQLVAPSGSTVTILSSEEPDFSTMIGQHSSMNLAKKRPDIKSSESVTRLERAAKRHRLPSTPTFIRPTIGNRMVRYPDHQFAKIHASPAPVRPVSKANPRSSKSHKATDK